MTTEIFITPPETPAEMVAADAQRNYDSVRSARMRNEATREEEITARAGLDVALEALKREREEKSGS